LKGATTARRPRTVSDILPLSEAPKAADRLRRKEGNPIRLVLRP